MTRTEWSPHEPLQLRAVYTVRELARAVGVTPHLMRSILRASGVELLQPTRLVLVPLSEIQEKLPQLWKSILLSEATRAEM
jgi:hypothetical protein